MVRNGHTNLANREVAPFVYFVVWSTAAYLRHKYSSLWSGQSGIPLQNKLLFKQIVLCSKHGDWPSGHVATSFEAAKSNIL